MELENTHNSGKYRRLKALNILSKTFDVFLEKRAVLFKIVLLPLLIAMCIMLLIRIVFPVEILDSSSYSAGATGKALLNLKIKFLLENIFLLPIGVMTFIAIIRLVVNEDVENEKGKKLAYRYNYTSVFQWEQRHTSFCLISLFILFISFLLYILSPAIFSIYEKELSFFGYFRYLYDLYVSFLDLERLGMPLGLDFNLLKFLVAFIADFLLVYFVSPIVMSALVIIAVEGAVTLDDLKAYIVKNYWALFLLILALDFMDTSFVFVFIFVAHLLGIWQNGGFSVEQEVLRDLLWLPFSYILIVVAPIVMGVYYRALRLREFSAL